TLAGACVVCTFSSVLVEESQPISKAASPIKGAPMNLFIAVVLVVILESLGDYNYCITNRGEIGAGSRCAALIPAKKPPALTCWISSTTQKTFSPLFSPTTKPQNWQMYRTPI